ncbi:MAG: S9 family peptidase, partial [Pseudobdellovibrionaceae bacterium]|nr:S9 family peptidase [Pseudobdellovibrionaceae bacterium]
LSDGPARYYRYDRPSKKAEFLFSNRPALEKLQLPELRPIIIPAQDGLKLVSYLTVPLSADSDRDGRPSQPLPLVLLVHGGPWARDSWGYNGQHQWLANRGYAVLSVNFRGSTGFGKKFVNAGNFEWAGKMHQDLLDAVDWAVQEKIADPQKVAIFGGSYGGYATLVGLTFTPDRFACGVDIVGPSNLNTLLESLPPYWQPMIEQFTKRVGNPKTEEGRKLLADRSPLHRAGAIKKPLLIGQGANDPRVKQAEADQIVKAMQEKKIPVTYALYPDEGHGFAKPQNRLSFNAIAESFLSSCLGGAHEPIGDDLIGSSLQVPTGVEHVPDLAQALKERK